MRAMLDNLETKPFDSSIFIYGQNSMVYECYGGIFNYWF